MKRADVGGQAVIEGVMMRGSKGEATAVRTPSGKIEIKFEKKIPITKKYKFLNYPFIRGIFVLVDSMKTGIGTLNYSASFFEEEEEESKLENWLKDKMGDKANDLIIGITMMVSLVISVLLFIALPTAIASIFAKLNINSIFLNLIEAIIRMVILFFYMYIISKMEEIYRVFQYHGAEHKTIFCYEAEEELTVENVKKFARFHPRCGTNFMFLIMFVSILIFSFTGWGGFFERIALRILLIPLVSGITYEIIKWLGKSDTSLATAVAYPGMKLQELTTKEPDDSQIEVAIAALMKAEGIVKKEEEKELGEILNNGANILKEAGIDSYRLDSQLILAHVLKETRLYIITNKDAKIPLKKEKEFLELVEKRKKKMPIKYILGEAEFMGLDFNIKEGVLIPRGDTEILVEEVLKLMDEEKPYEVCDLCSGSGAIGISLAHFRKNITVDEIDFFPIPQEVTEGNIKKHNLQDRVKFIKSDLLKEVIGNKKYDIIVSNPPYIRDEEVNNLMEDVKDYEPHTALAGGIDGLDFYNRIVLESKDVLKEDSILAFEIGYDQGIAVKKLLEDNGFTNVSVHKDLAGLDRVVLGYFKY